MRCCSYAAGGLVCYSVYEYHGKNDSNSKKKQTLVRRSSEASVNTDFEMIMVDIRCRKTDWKNGVSVFDWTAETQ